MSISLVQKQSPKGLSQLECNMVFSVIESSIWVAEQEIQCYWEIADSEHSEFQAGNTVYNWQFLRQKICDMVVLLRLAASEKCAADREFHALLWEDSWVLKNMEVAV